MKCEGQTLQSTFRMLKVKVHDSTVRKKTEQVHLVWQGCQEKASKKNNERVSEQNTESKKRPPKGPGAVVGWLWATKVFCIYSRSTSVMRPSVTQLKLGQKCFRNRTVIPSKTTEKEMNHSVATAQSLQLDRNAVARPSESRALMNPNKPQWVEAVL